MTIKRIVDEDFSNYKKPSMLIAFPYCSFKCEEESGEMICQNKPLTKSHNIEISTTEIVSHYLDNPLTSAIVCGGLEPIDSWEDLQDMVSEFRKYTNDDIVIFTGYNEKEILGEIYWLRRYPNVVIKFGRYIPDQEKHYDETLGVELASSNQYARRIS